MKIVYIYALKCPINNNIQYIGKTINLKKRLYSHITEAKSSKKRRNVLHWIYSLILINKKPLLEIIEICNEFNWEEKEKYWINYYKSINPNLSNMAEGGLGGSGKKIYTQAEITKRANEARERFSKFNEKDKLKIWELIQAGNTVESIKKTFPNYTRHIHFGVSNGRQWNNITKLNKTYGKIKRKGYTCNNGYYRVRDKNRKTIFTSKDEKAVKKYVLSLNSLGVTGHDTF